MKTVDANSTTMRDNPSGRDDGRAPLSSEELLAGARVRTIRHGDEHYYLRLTRNGKLILCK